MKHVSSRLLSLLLVLALLLSMVPAAFAADGAPVPAGEAADAQWEEVSDIISQYYGEWTEPTYPDAVNNRMPFTALLGNGDVGVSSDGSATEKRFNISKGDFWEYNGTPLAVGSVTIGQLEVADPAVSYVVTDEAAETSQVTMTCTTPGASIYYTLDGSEPSETNGILYTGPFTLTGTTWVKLIAVKDGWIDSFAVSQLVGAQASVPEEDLLLHLDAADLALENGAAVVEWPSKVGGHSALSEHGATAALKDYGSYKGVYFDGNGATLKITGFDNLNGKEDLTFVLVTRAAQAGQGNEWGWGNSAIYIPDTGDWGGVMVGSFQEKVVNRIGIGSGASIFSYNRPKAVTGLTATMVRMDSGTEELYVDGELVKTARRTNAAVSNSNSTELFIGRGWSGFVGDVAEVLIYDRTLTEEEIESLNLYLDAKYFSNESAALLAEEAPASEPVAYYEKEDILNAEVLTRQELLGTPLQIES